MAFPQERTPQERETLVFPDREKAREFTERVEGRFKRENQPGVDKRQEIVSEELANQFDRDGEPVDIIRTPWDHTKEEHAEAQELVDLSFAENLSSALRKAGSSANYPRNLDLFHDVLTGEMYKLVVEHKLNKQPLSVGLLIVSVVVTAGVLGFVLLITFMI